MTDPRKSSPAEESAEESARFEAGELESELVEARRRAEEYLNDLRRVAADFDNYRKRVARDSEAQAQRASESIVSELLPVLDNLERALDASEHHEEAQVAEGVEPRAHAAGRHPAPARHRGDRGRAGHAVRSARARGALATSRPSIPTARSPPCGSGATASATGSCARRAWSSRAARADASGEE